MTRPFDRALAVGLILACCIAASISAAVADDEPINLEQIKAKAAEWRACFHNLRVVYELRSLPETDVSVEEWSPLSVDRDSAPKFCEAEWIRSDQGLDLLDDRSFYWSPGHRGIRTIDVANAPEGFQFHAMYQKPPEGAEQFTHLELKPSWPGPQISGMNCPPMSGLFWPHTAEWLPDKLSKGEWKLEGIEPILGQPCVRMTTDYPRPGGTGVEMLWLDMQHGWLPRRHLLLATSDRKRGLDFVVDEIQQLEGGLWFPKLGRLRLPTSPGKNQNQLIVVTEAAINVTIDEARFEIPEVEKATSVSDQRTTNHLFQNETRTPSPEPASAIPAGLRGIGWVIAVICVVFAVLASGLNKRKKV